jgi:5-bromo-4-chloroindolyl phosphate hydrolysis protein
MTSNRVEKHDYTACLIFISVLLVLLGLIGMGSIEPNQLLFALPLTVLLLLYFVYDGLKQKRSPGYENKRERKQSVAPLFLVPYDDEKSKSHPLYSRMLQVLVTADKDIRQIRMVAGRLEDPPISEALYELCRIAEAINTKVRLNPGILPNVQRFYTYYLHTARTLWNQYEGLIRSPYYSKEMEYEVKRIENLLTPLKRNFQRHLNRVLRGELVEVELEVNTLEQLMRSEG